MHQSFLLCRVVSMSIRVASVCASLMVLANGFSVGLLGQRAAMANSPADTFAQSMAQNSLTSTLPSLVARRIQQDLAKRLNVPADFITIDEATRQVWPDQCLGLARPSERCQGGEVRGWEVKVHSVQQSWVYRSDRAARRLRLAPLPGATELNSPDFSPQLAQKLLETVSQQVQQPIFNLRILGVQATSLNECSSMTSSNTPCSETAPGFRVIIADGERKSPYDNGYLYQYLPDLLQREWVYSLSEDGSQIVYNEAASDITNTTAVFFSDTDETGSTPLGSEVIAELKITGDGTQWITLTADGNLTAHLGSLDPNEPHELFKTIQPAEVDAFKALLQARHFENFDGMGYQNINPSWASEGYSTFIAGGTYVILNNGSDELPADLQAIYEAWNELIY
jgi:hypothetical protein